MIGAFAGAFHSLQRQQEIIIHSDRSVGRRTRAQERSDHLNIMRHVSINLNTYLGR